MKFNLDHMESNMSIEQEVLLASLDREKIIYRIVFHLQSILLTVILHMSIHYQHLARNIIEIEDNLCSVNKFLNAFVP